MAEARRSERVRAYEALHDLQWALDSLPDDHPSVYHVQQAIVAAEQHWRKLLGDYNRPGIDATGPAPPPAGSSPLTL